MEHVQPNRLVLTYVALALGVASWFGPGFVCSIPAIILARHELKAWERGELPSEGRIIAQIAFWVSVVNIALSVLARVLFVIYAICFVGMMSWVPFFF